MWGPGRYTKGAPDRPSGRRLHGHSLALAGLACGFALFGLAGCAQSRSSQHRDEPTSPAEGPPDNMASTGQCAPTLSLRIEPTARAQMAIWIEDPAGERLETLLVTEAVGLRGIGNRPGAMHLNSGYRFPVGRRENALPMWASRRVALGGTPFRRVIYQHKGEGILGATGLDHSPDSYFCLPFDADLTRREGLDAVSCASPYRGDKGRYLTEADEGYAQPAQYGGAGIMEPLGLTSLYPPRRDIVRCDAEDCFDHPDVDRFAQDALAAMPELDAVTTATLAAEPVELRYPLDPSWLERGVTLFLEVNTEGDYGQGDATEPLPETPTLPDGEWDTWSNQYGYPYQGQPAVVFRVTDLVPPDELRAASLPWRGSSFARGEMIAAGPLHDDPDDAPGTGVDRLRRGAGGERVLAVVHCRE